MPLALQRLLRPDQVLGPAEFNTGGIERERLPSGPDLSALDPLAAQRILRRVLEHVHAVVERVIHARRVDVHLLIGGGGEVDVPGPAHAMDLRRPDQVGQRALLVAAPDGHLLGGLQIVEVRRPAQDDPVVLGVRGGEEVLVAMPEHTGICALQHQRVHGRCVTASHAVPSSEMASDRVLSHERRVIPDLVDSASGSPAARPSSRDASRTVNDVNYCRHNVRGHPRQHRDRSGAALRCCPKTALTCSGR